MVFITGDTHGEFECLGSKYIEAKKGDYVIVCGDFGNVWDNSETEKYWREWLCKKPFTTLFIDGNHENYDMLNAYPVTEWGGGKVHKIADNIIHLMRGQVFDIEGTRFFTMGGASSHDIDDGILDPDDPNFYDKRKRLNRAMASYRINHISWWKEEMPSDEEMREGLDSLNRAGNKVDVILSHCAPSSVQDIFSGGLYQHDKLTNYLESIKEKCDFKLWFFGHYHDDRTVGQKFVMLYHKTVALSQWLG